MRPTSSSTPRSSGIRRRSGSTTPWTTRSGTSRTACWRMDGARRTRPTSAADFCHFTLDYPGDLFPDYPKLGDSFSWGLVGINTYDPPGFGFVSSDVMWFHKPPPGSTCNQPLAGLTTNLRDQSGTQTFTPIPAQSTERPLILSDGVIVSVDPYD